MRTLRACLKKWLSYEYTRIGKEKSLETNIAGESFNFSFKFDTYPDFQLILAALDSPVHLSRLRLLVVLEVHVGLGFHFGLDLQNFPLYLY